MRGSARRTMRGFTRSPQVPLAGGATAAGGWRGARRTAVSLSTSVTAATAPGPASAAPGRRSADRVVRAPARALQSSPRLSSSARLDEQHGTGVRRAAASSVIETSRQCRRRARAKRIQAREPGIASRRLEREPATARCRRAARLRSRLAAPQPQRRTGSAPRAHARAFTGSACSHISISRHRRRSGAARRIAGNDLARAMPPARRARLDGRESRPVPGCAAAAPRRRAPELRIRRRPKAASNPRRAPRSPRP